MLFGYAQTALNADATFEYRLHDCNKGLLPTILLWKGPFLRAFNIGVATVYCHSKVESTSLTRMLHYLKYVGNLAGDILSIINISMYVLNEILLHFFFISLATAVGIYSF